MSVVPLRVEDREQLRGLLNSRRADDARAAYYALQHPAARVRLWIHAQTGGRAESFLIRAQTGQDLFRPLVILRASHPGAAEELLRTALPPGAPFLLSLTEAAAHWPLPIRIVEAPALLYLLELDVARFEPVVNIFVTRSKSPDGLPRYEIRQGDRLLAAAGLNWQSSDWAEVFVSTEPDLQNRGYGKSVVAALCAQLVAERRRVLFAVEESNLASRRLAEGLGFHDTGGREQVLVGLMAEDASPENRFERLA